MKKIAIKKMPWERYTVGKPSTNKYVNETCQELVTISHVAHIHHAIRVLQDEKLVSGLIHDKSNLNKERITVCWLSPNHWAHGSRYGNVEFEFNFKTLIQERNYYWVEDIAYGIAACRILITINDYSSNLTPYDPTIGNGPWYYDDTNDVHYWNGKYCLEFMFEEDIPIKKSSKLRFVDHHKDFCNVDYTTCKDKGKSNIIAKRKLMEAYLQMTCDLAGRFLRKEGNLPMS